MNFELEIACFSLEALSSAQSAGATRVEFCVDYSSGGTSPDSDQIRKARALLKIPLHVIVRPRPGNFVYSKEEVGVMKELIVFCRNTGVNGVVFGVLNSQGRVDLEVCRELVELARPMKVCFHRAIDECLKPEQEIESLIEVGVDYLLSSGTKKNVEEGTGSLAAWQKKFGTKIKIMPGGSLRSKNIGEIVNTTACRSFHSSAIVGDGHLPDEGEIKKMLEILRKHEV